jgi:dihydrodipicolinate synthase/N-acetylneuraminate lyase
MGGAGCISAAAHLCTERFVAMIDCGLAGKVDDGRAHAEALLPVVQACFAEPNPAVFKGVLHAQGGSRPRMCACRSLPLRMQQFALDAVARAVTAPPA